MNFNRGMGSPEDGAAGAMVLLGEAVNLVTTTTTSRGTPNGSYPHAPGFPPSLNNLYPVFNQSIGPKTSYTARRCRRLYLCNSGKYTKHSDSYTARSRFYSAHSRTGESCPHAFYSELSGFRKRSRREGVAYVAR